MDIENTALDAPENKTPRTMPEDETGLHDAAEQGRSGCACAGGCGCGGCAEKAGSDEDMVEVAGCRSRRSGPVTFFLTDGLELAVGDKVLVENEAGVVLAEVRMLRRMGASHVPAGDGAPLSPVLAKATDADIARSADNDTLANEARKYCQECIRNRRLDMKLVDVEVAHDKSKIAFYFTAPSRIDFRELVKDLVRRYRTRIELRQIGVRHETQMLGAIGNCGMVCCCRRYLRKFAPVAIKMAKEQNVFLNPAKISGICGRLLCCLSYEQENYDNFYRRCPKLGKKYHTTRGVMRVLRANMFRETISVLSEHNEELEFSLEEWQTLEPHRPEPQPGSGVGERSDGRGPRDRNSRPRKPGREGSERAERPERGGRSDRRQPERRPERRDELGGSGPERKDRDAAPQTEGSGPRPKDSGEDRSVFGLRKPDPASEE